MADVTALFQEVSKLTPAEAGELGDLLKALSSPAKQDSAPESTPEEEAAEAE